MGTLSVDKLMKTSTGAAEFTLPATDGTAGQVMQTDGAGQLSVAALAADTVTATQIAADAVGVAELSATGTASGSTALFGDNAWKAVSDVSGLASVQTFTSSGTWTRPSGITKVIMEVQAAGGSGSGSANTEDCQGGGGGGYAKKFLDVSSISTSTITVGAGGAGVAGNGINAGNIGGASSWADGTNTITGNGGGAGETANDTPTIGGTATNGDINIQGGDGASRYSGNFMVGGDSMLGFGGMPKVQTRTIVARPPRGYGAGSGASHFYSGTVYNSENGGAGIVIVWEYK